MDIAVYFINLDRSKERFAKLKKQLAALPIKAIRVAAIDGRTIDFTTCCDIDWQKFQRIHGKKLLAGEAGCYLSHLKALELVSAGSEQYAVIIEDDVRFAPNFTKIVSHLINFSGFDMIKLVNHRNRLFRPYVNVTDGYQIGRSLHGPQGSAAAYLVTQKGAARLVAILKPMTLPYDVAIERGWQGFESYTLNKNIVYPGVDEMPTTIGNKLSYQNAKLPVWRRLPTLRFRVLDYCRRIGYGFKPGKLVKKENIQ